MTTQDRHALNLASALIRTLRDELVKCDWHTPHQMFALEAGAMALDAVSAGDSTWLAGQATKKAHEAYASFKHGTTK